MTKKQSIRVSASLTKALHASEESLRSRVNTYLDTLALAHGELVRYSASDTRLIGLPDISGGCFRGRAFCIELKAEDGVLEPLQRDWLRVYAAAGAIALVLWAQPDAPAPMYARYTRMLRTGRFGPPVDCVPGWFEALACS